MRFGKNVKRPVGNYYLGNEEISIRSEEKDLGVIITDNLSFGKHINKIIGETYKLKNIKIAFSYIDEDMIKKKNDNNNMSKIEVCSISVVAKLEKGYK